MRLRIVVTAALLAFACSGEEMAGDKDGYCDIETDANGNTVTHAPGEYRCAGNMVEVCTEGPDPLRDRPVWYVLQDCALPVAFQYGACILDPTSRVARCVYSGQVVEAPEPPDDTP